MLKLYTRGTEVGLIEVTPVLGTVYRTRIFTTLSFLGL
jgi:hypothetical protein